MADSQKKIVIELPNGFQLVAEANPDEAYSNEIFIGIIDGNGVWWQDLAVVRNAYEIINNEIVWKDGKFDVLVYADENSEDYTHRFTIDQFRSGAI